MHLAIFLPEVLFKDNYQNFLDSETFLQVDNEKSKYNYEEAEGTIKLKEEASYDEEYSE